MNEACVFGIFCRQLAVIMRANVSPRVALEICRDQIENKKLKKAVDHLILEVSRGDKVSDAMKQQEDYFPMIMICAVECAEKTGRWCEMLNNLAEQFEAEARLAGTSRRMTFIPSIMALLCVIILGIVALQIVPKFLGMFNGIDYDLPKLTRVVIGCSSFVAEHYGLIILAIAGILLIWFLFSLFRAGRSVNARIRMFLPFTGKVNRQKLYAQFCKSLSTLLKNGMPIHEAVRVIEDSVGNNELIRNELLKASERVAQGMSLSKALSDSTVFSQMILQMTAIGEESGNLPAVLDDMATYYEAHMLRDANKRAYILETVFVVLLGVLLCVVVAAMVQPMLEFYEMVKGM